MTLKPEETGTLALFTFPQITWKTFSCWWQNMENTVLVMIYCWRNFIKLGCDHVPSYQLYHWEKKTTETYISSNSYNKCSVFLGGVRKYFPRLHILTPKVQSFKCYTTWCYIQSKMIPSISHPPILTRGYHILSPMCYSFTDQGLFYQTSLVLNLTWIHKETFT